MRAATPGVEVEVRAADPDDVVYLRARGAEAVMFPTEPNAYLIMFLDPAPTTSAVLEEFSHVLQDLRADYVDRPLQEMAVLREIDVAECLVANADRLGIGPEETRATKALLARYRMRLRDLEEHRR